MEKEEWNELTLISFKVIISVANVVLITDGLFLTLGKMTPPLRDIGFVGDDDVGDVDEPIEDDV